MSQLIPEAAAEVDEVDEVVDVDVAPDSELLPQPARTPVVASAAKAANVIRDFSMSYLSRCGYSARAPGRRISEEYRKAAPANAVGQKLAHRKAEGKLRGQMAKRLRRPWATRAAASLFGLLVLAACASPPSAQSGSGRTATGADGPADGIPVVVSAPLSSAPWVGASIVAGARVAIGDVNAAGGVQTPKGPRPLRLVVLDNAGSATKASENARTAVADHAAILLTDGMAAASVAAITAPTHLPVFVCFDGTDSLVDPVRRPTLFRMAPANAPMASRLADYIANARPKVAVLTDGTTYGVEGGRAVERALDVDHVQVVSRQKLPADGSDARTQVAAAKAAGADRLVVWTSATGVAATVRAVHDLGWDVPILSGPTGEDPLVRQRLAGAPEALAKLTFVSFRITSEVGPGPFELFRKHFEEKAGTNRTGLHQDGKEVVQPPDWEMFAYDVVQLTVVAFKHGGDVGGKLLQTFNAVRTVGANGDARGYTPTQHEGVNPSDMYFARFDGFVFTPVRDDPLSEGLPDVNQLQP